jgi:hypothetical protein
MPEYNLAMANTFCSLKIHCIFSSKERALMLNPELRERLWPFLGGIAKLRNDDEEGEASQRNPDFRKIFCSSLEPIVFVRQIVIVLEVVLGLFY